MRENRIRTIWKGGGAVVNGWLAIPNAFSADISELQFNERAPGVYAAPIKARHAGLWEFRLTMDNGVDHVTVVLRSDLAPGGAA